MGLGVGLVVGFAVGLVVATRQRSGGGGGEVCARPEKPARNGPKKIIEVEVPYPRMMDTNAEGESGCIRTGETSA